MNIGRCKGCGQPIVWIVTTKGKKMPCDPQPVTGYGDHTTVKKDKIVTVLFWLILLCIKSALGWR